VQVNIGPPDRSVPAAPFPGALRASDADRERAVDTLKTAFVQGRLTRDELDLRTGQALESRTYTELAAATTGIPAVRAEGWARPRPTRARKPVTRKVVAWTAAAVVVPTASWAAFLTYYGGFFVLFLLALIGMAVSAGPWPSRHGFTGAPTGANIRRR
jgi:hypothetical protein